MKSVGFTGHRPAQLGGYDENNPVAIRVKQNLKTLIIQAYEAGYRKFITGMAMGVDQWAGEIVAELKKQYPDVILVAAVPFATQSSIWYQKSKQDWLRVLSFCDEIYIIDTQPDSPVTLDELLTLSKIPNTDAKYTISHKMNKRNEWMVDESDSMIAVFKQTPGGTANCVQYAKSQGKKIISYNPDSDSVVKL